MSKKMAVLLAEGFEEAEAVVPMDIAMRAGVEVTKVSVSGEESVKGAHGIAVGTDMKLDDLDAADYDMLMLPGGMSGTTNLESTPKVAEAINISLPYVRHPGYWETWGSLKGSGLRCTPVTKGI